MCSSRRHCFVVEAAPAPDTLVRVLTPFAVQGARLASVVMDDGRIRIEVDGLDARAVDTLVQRLRGMPVVTGVAIGWRMGLPGAAPTPLI